MSTTTASSKGRVLVVDAERPMAEMVADGLTARGYEALFEKSARRAAQLLEDGSIDALITDLRMPEMDGLAQGARSAAPFVSINCAALPETLLETELFGHAKGAFTGAATARAGLFAEANGGTLLLDEIGEMSSALQANLLHVVETGSVRALGEFREDLMYRLEVVTIELPPLRLRLKIFPRTSASTLQTLLASRVRCFPCVKFRSAMPLGLMSDRQDESWSPQRRWGSMTRHWPAGYRAATEHCISEIVRAYADDHASRDRIDLSDASGLRVVRLCFGAEPRRLTYRASPRARCHRTIFRETSTSVASVTYGAEQHQRPDRSRPTAGA